MPLLMTDVDTCPLCDRPNACGMAAGQSHCWCFETVIPPEVLARVPAADHSRRCVCQACATRPTGSAA